MTEQQRMERARAEQQRMERARLIQEEPAWLFIICYAVVFLSCSAFTDFLSLFTTPPSTMEGFGRYSFPLAIILPGWLGLRSWAKRLLEACPSEAKI